MKDETILKCVAIGGITVIEVANVLTANIDSMVFIAVIGVIAGIAGYTVGNIISYFKK